MTCSLMVWGCHIRPLRRRSRRSTIDDGLRSSSVALFCVSGAERDIMVVRRVGLCEELPPLVGSTTFAFFGTLLYNLYIF